jgi:hypothetical protein
VAKTVRDLDTAGFFDKVLDQLDKMTVQWVTRARRERNEDLWPSEEIKAAIKFSEEARKRVLQLKHRRQFIMAFLDGKRTWKDTKATHAVASSLLGDELANWNRKHPKVKLVKVKNVTAFLDRASVELTELRDSVQEAVGLVKYRKQKKPLNSLLASLSHMIGLAENQKVRLKEMKVKNADLKLEKVITKRAKSIDEILPT